MVQQSTCFSSLYFGAGLLMFASGGYLSGAFRKSLTHATVGGCCRCVSTLRFVSQLVFVVISYCCHHRWSLMRFDVIPTICLTNLRPDDNRMRAMQAHIESTVSVKRVRERGVTPAASELETMPIPRKRSGVENV